MSVGVLISDSPGINIQSNTYNLGFAGVGGDGGDGVGHAAPDGHDGIRANTYTLP